MGKLLDKGQQVKKRTQSLLSESGRTLLDSRELVTKRKVWAEFGRKVWRQLFLWNILAIFLIVIVDRLPQIQTALYNIQPTKYIDSGEWEVFFSVFGIIYAIIVGMLIVEALSRFNNLRALTEQELNAVEDIRDFLIYLDDDDEARPAIWAGLLAYVNSVVKKEWEKMRDDPAHMDSDTSAQLYQIMKEVRKIKVGKGTSGVALESIMNKIAELTTYRTDRIKRSVEYVTLPLRVLILGLSIALVVGLILMVIPFGLKLFMVIVTVAAMTTLYVLISDLNRPFAEEELWTIDNKSFKEVAKGLRKLQRDWMRKGYP